MPTAILSTFNFLPSPLYLPSANRHGQIRTDDLLRPRQADFQAFPHAGIESRKGKGDRGESDNGRTSVARVLFSSLLFSLSSLFASRTSTQRESNPHIRHGKPVGFRYIMGAKVVVKLSKNYRESRKWK